jgi:hypothetical protein
LGNIPPAKQYRSPKAPKDSQMSANDWERGEGWSDYIQAIFEEKLPRQPPKPPKSLEEYRRQFPLGSLWRKIPPGLERQIESRTLRSSDPVGEVEAVWIEIDGNTWVCISGLDGFGKRMYLAQDLDAWNLARLDRLEDELKTVR